MVQKVRKVGKEQVGNSQEEIKKGDVVIRTSFRKGGGGGGGTPLALTTAPSQMTPSLFIRLLGSRRKVSCLSKSISDISIGARK